MFEKIHLGSGLREAMRLMKSGDLRGATAAIQRRLGGQVAPSPEAPTPGAEPPVADHAGLLTREQSHEEATLVTPEKGGGKSRFIGGTYAGSAGQRRYKLFI